MAADRLPAHEIKTRACVIVAYGPSWEVACAEPSWKVTCVCGWSAQRASEAAVLEAHRLHADAAAVSPAEPPTGVELIAAERQRQIEVEGWTPEHDDEHMEGELSGAASSYAAVASKQIGSFGMEAAYAEQTPSQTWRWSSEWWKPSADPLRNLVRAGALIAAEIDRLQRERRDV